MRETTDRGGCRVFGAGLRDQEFATVAVALVAPHPAVEALAVVPEDVVLSATTRRPLRSRSHDSHYQNSSFNANCMIRGFTLIAVIFPNVLGLATSLAGLAKLSQLKTLKTSQRNTTLAFSPSLVRLMSAMSTLRWPGPLRMFLPRFPKIVPPPVTGNFPLMKPPSGMNGAGTNTLVLKN